MQRLLANLKSLEGKPYGTIRKIMGTYDFGYFRLKFLRIQGSPGAHPASIAEVTTSGKKIGFPESYFSDPRSRKGLEEFLIRRFHDGISRFAKQNRGADGSGSFHTVELSQIMVDRDAIEIDEQKIALRFIVSLPSRPFEGMKFDGKEAVVMFEEEMPAICDHTFLFENYDKKSINELNAFVSVLEDRWYIERKMKEEGWICFIPEEAILPRKSGVDDRPMEGETVIPFQSPASMKVSIPLKEGMIEGMAIKEGVTVITGGGFHGKSTLLHVIAEGIYPHVPGDGRERVVTREDAMTIKSEEGRSVRKVDISAFIKDLPAKKARGNSLPTTPVEAPLKPGILSKR